jgi:hypothetical protein
MFGAVAVLRAAPRGNAGPRALPRHGRSGRSGSQRPGCDGSVVVHTVAGVNEEFISDLENPCFPARIRAAGTVLQERGCYGRFLISRRRGLLSFVAKGWKWPTVLNTVATVHRRRRTSNAVKRHRNGELAMVYPSA